MAFQFFAKDRMGTCCSVPDPSLEQEPMPEPEPRPEPVVVPMIQNPILVVPRKPHSQQVFWATPVFVYNRTLPSDGYTYTPVHPVEPFHVQRYAIQSA
jgi:hypothetical protein